MIKKPATIKQIAELLNVSVSTVSRALHKHPSIGAITQLRVQKLARELKYEPNQAAIFFQKGKTYTIGVILPELSETFFSAAISAIEETAYKRNYVVLLAQSHDDEKIEKQMVEKLKNHRVDGLLVSVSRTTSSFAHFEMLKKHNIPIVFFDRIPPIKDIHYVSCNMKTGSMEAVHYLFQKGHRIIGMINGQDTLASSHERKDGYIKATVKSRLKFDPSLIVSCDLTESGTQAAFDKLLTNKRRPTAIVTFNDYIYLYAIKYVHDTNIDPDKKIQFVSYANLPTMNYMQYGPIASIEQFPFLQGQKATDILMDLISQKGHLVNSSQAYYNVVVESKLMENDKSHN